MGAWVIRAAAAVLGAAWTFPQEDVQGVSRRGSHWHAAASGRSWPAFHSVVSRCNRRPLDCCLSLLSSTSTPHLSWSHPILMSGSLPCNITCVL